MSGDHRLIDIILDEASLAVANPDVEHERRVAIFDLLEANQFELVDLDAGPYALRLSVADSRLVLGVTGADGSEARTIVLSITPLRKMIKDYFLICESYHSAIRSATPAQIEAIDMGRRSLHDEGGELVAQRLSGKVRMDRETARRLFTLICALRARS
jgi:uncharacterized protein (UPF0262 family)